MIKQIVSYLLLSCFLFWLIPLGQFIARDREAQACGGQRAFCMCMAKAVKKESPTSAKLIVAVHPSTQEQAPVSGGAGHDFMIPKIVLNLAQSQMLPFIAPIHLSSLQFIRSIEHVPKI